MSANLTLGPASEERELQKRRAELVELEAQIAQRESDLAGLKAELRTFEVRYLTVIGSRYDELAEVEARINQAQGLGPETTEEGWAINDEVGCGQNRFHSGRIKQLYREVARKFHPDLAADEHERSHRHQLMIEVNRAYELGAEERLQALLEAELSCPDWAKGREAAAELVLVLHRIAQARERLAALEAEKAQMMASEIYKLKLRVEKAEAAGLDLLAELVAQVERQIVKAKNRLVHLQGGAG